MKLASGNDRIASMLIFALVLTGCQSIGPRTVPTDRFDYSSAIADSWKQQTLLTIVSSATSTCRFLWSVVRRSGLFVANRHRR